MIIYDCIFLDRDGTINFDPGYIKHIDEFKLYSYTIDALRKLSSITKSFCIVSNQSGVSRGIINIDELNKIHDFVKLTFKRHNINLLDILIATDHPDKITSNRRKPGIGMFIEAKIAHGIKLKNCLMIGDSHTDIESGSVAGMESMLVLSGIGNLSLKKFKNNLWPNYIVNNLSEGADLLCKEKLEY